MTDTLTSKLSKLHEVFLSSDTNEEKYEKIMALGKALPKLASDKKCEENLVSGCQSIMYLTAEIREGLLFFHAESDALISAGLAALMTHVYSGETPEVILKAEPLFLKELGIIQTLSPNRANGLMGIMFKMKQCAIAAIATM